MPSNQALTTKYFGDASEEKLVTGTLGDWMPAQQASAPEANDGEETAGLANTFILLTEEASMLVCCWFVSKLLITEALPLPAFSQGQAHASLRFRFTHKFFERGKLPPLGSKVDEGARIR